MTGPVVQRWRARRDSYRPAGEVIDTRRFEVSAIRQDSVAKRFVLEHHYSGSYPAARFRFGLYRGGALVGVAVFSEPCNDGVLSPIGVPHGDAAELGRFVLLDDVPANGESWFLARCFELLRADLAGVVSFSDPVPRSRADGTRVFPGHIGTIYQATNAVYLGRGTCRTLRILPDGTVFSDRAAQKIRKLERGWQYAAALLQAHGAGPVDDDPAAWLKRSLGALTRKMRHPGNHKYAFGIDRGVRRRLPASLPYPKLSEERLS